jgi:serine protease Do
MPFLGLGLGNEPMRMLRVSLPIAALILGAGFSVSAAASELRRSAIVEAVASCRDSVVNIHGEKIVPPAQDASGDLKRVNGMGTGVVIDSRGYVVTNFHVVEGIKRIEVTLANGRTTAASLVAHDPRTDLAVIKLDTSESLPVARIGTSNDLMVGETVLALGNAYGYEHTVTRGIISALKRNVEVSRTQRYDDLIQTDASINPGNSGGPLLNIDGEVIGINVAVRAGAQGIGFAIPIDRVLDIVSQLIAAERIGNTWHGLVVRADGRRGAVVQAVHSQSPAESGGVREGDLLKQVGDVPVLHQIDIERALLGRKIGERVPVTVARAGADKKIELSLAASRHDSLSLADRCWQELGLRLEPLQPAVVQNLQARYRGGLVVTAVRADGPAAEQGISKGDILVGLHVWETVAADNIAFILDKAKKDHVNPIKFYVLRGREMLVGHIVFDTLRR